jgi:hypothetical protein
LPIGSWRHAGSLHLVKAYAFRKVPHKPCPRHPFARFPGRAVHLLDHGDARQGRLPNAMGQFTEHHASRHRTGQSCSPRKCRRGRGRIGGGMSRGTWRRLRGQFTEAPPVSGYGAVYRSLESAHAPHVRGQFTEAHTRFGYGAIYRSSESTPVPCVRGHFTEALGGTLPKSNGALYRRRPAGTHCPAAYRAVCRNITGRFTEACERKVRYGSVYRTLRAVNRGGLVDIIRSGTRKGGVGCQSRTRYRGIRSSSNSCG